MNSAIDDRPAASTPFSLDSQKTSEASEPWAALGEVVSRTDLVAEAMKRAILDGTLAPGEQLTERDVAGRLGVSKTPVRDAFKLLRLTGLVEVSSFQRVRVRRIDGELVAELYQARHLIEPLAVGLAVQARGAKPSSVAHQALAEAKASYAAGDMAGVSLANRRFHRELYQDCTNRFLRQELDQLQDLTALSATVGWRYSKSSTREATQHEALLVAFEKGKRELTVELLAEHIDSATGVVLDAVSHSMDAQD